MVWYSHLFKNFPQFVVIHTVKGFGIGNEAEVNVFLEFSCFLCDPVNVGNLISGSSAFSKTSLYIWKFSVHILLKPSLKDFEYNFTRMWNKYNCTVVWTFLALPFFGVEIKKNKKKKKWKLTFSSPLATVEFSKLANVLNAAL